MSNVSFSQKNEKRHRLRLPQLHYVACDDWIDKLGERALCAWLRFITWADRSAEDRENDTIPNSLGGIAKKLGVSLPTFYKHVIRPLWDYKLIDLQEYEMGKNNTCLNIVIYSYPQDDETLMTKPLEKVRDYESEYVSSKRTNAQMGAKKRKASIEQSDKGETILQKKVLKKFKLRAKRDKAPLLKKIKRRAKNILANNVLNSSNSIKSLSNSSKYLTNVNQSVEESLLPSMILSILEKTGMTNRLTEISMVYESVKELDNFNRAVFIQTLLKKAVQREARNSEKADIAFQQYLLSAVLNNLSVVPKTNVSVESRMPEIETQEPGMDIVRDVLKKTTGLPRSVIQQESANEIARAFGIPWFEASEKAGLLLDTLYQRV